MFVIFLLGKSFQQQREAMKQTIEEDKEPEKSGQFPLSCNVKVLALVLAVKRYKKCLMLVFRETVVCKEKQEEEKEAALQFP